MRLPNSIFTVHQILPKYFLSCNNPPWWPYYLNNYVLLCNGSLEPYMINETI